MVRVSVPPEFGTTVTVFPTTDELEMTVPFESTTL
jgi:hypothetical protein